jgi:hypothetical protein
LKSTCSILHLSLLMLYRTNHNAQQHQSTP